MREYCQHKKQQLQSGIGGPSNADQVGPPIKIVENAQPTLLVEEVQLVGVVQVTEDAEALRYFKFLLFILYNV